MKNKTFLILVSAALMAASGLPAAAESGFYGGISVSEGASAPNGLKRADVPLTWTRFAAPVTDDTVPRSMVFGGYRWKSDVSFEAAFNTGDKYSLQPRRVAAGAGFFGLSSGDVAAHTWNADVYTSWEMVRSLSLYGRLGYAQTETRPLFAGASIVPGDIRRAREGVNYGVGLRYDMSQSLGLRVEYARFGRFVGEAATGGLLPESDQVMIGVQFKF
ncbi:MAG: outer membrane beta-barrel protein [Betaproteobacteria bacterium]